MLKIAYLYVWASVRLEIVHQRVPRSSDHANVRGVSLKNRDLVEIAAQEGKSSWSKLADMHTMTGCACRCSAVQMLARYPFLRHAYVRVSSWISVLFEFSGPIEVMNMQMFTSYSSKCAQVRAGPSSSMQMFGDFS